MRTSQLCRRFTRMQHIPQRRHTAGCIVAVHTPFALLLAEGRNRLQLVKTMLPLTSTTERCQRMQRQQARCPSWRHSGVRCDSSL